MRSEALDGSGAGSRVQRISSQLLNPCKFRLYLFRHLPAAWFMGLRLKELTPERAVVELPYRWRSQNPFRSIYFAAQAAAAEFPSGVLALLAVEAAPASVSMLVSRISIEYFKKATRTLSFTCEAGEELRAAVAKAIEEEAGSLCTVQVEGRDPGGELVSRATLEWTFKARAKRKP